MKGKWWKGGKPTASYFRMVKRCTVMLRDFEGREVDQPEKAGRVCFERFQPDQRGRCEEGQIQEGEWSENIYRLTPAALEVIELEFGDLGEFERVLLHKQTRKPRQARKERDRSEEARENRKQEQERKRQEAKERARARVAKTEERLAAMGSGQQPEQPQIFLPIPTIKNDCLPYGRESFFTEDSSPLNPPQGCINFETLDKNNRLEGEKIACRAVELEQPPQPAESNQAQQTTIQDQAQQPIKEQINPAPLPEVPTSQDQETAPAQPAKKEAQKLADRPLQATIQNKPMMDPYKEIEAACLPDSVKAVLLKMTKFVTENNQKEACIIQQGQPIPPKEWAEQSNTNKICAGAGAGGRAGFSASPMIKSSQNLLEQGVKDEVLHRGFARDTGPDRGDRWNSARSGNGRSGLSSQDGGWIDPSSLPRPNPSPAQSTASLDDRLSGDKGASSGGRIDGSGWKLYRRGRAGTVFTDDSQEADTSSSDRDPVRAGSDQGGGRPLPGRWGSSGGKV